MGSMRIFSGGGTVKGEYAFGSGIGWLRATNDSGLGRMKPVTGEHGFWFAIPVADGLG